MTDVPTWRARAGLTNRRLAALAAVLVVVLGAVAVYLMNRPDPRPAAEPLPYGSAQVATPPPSVSAATGASGRPAGSAATGRPAATATRSPQPPDSDVNPNAAFVDPAAPSGAPPWATGVPPTCAQWRESMSDDQRMSYSTALLRAAWQIAGSSASPPASTASTYRSAITDACAGQDMANGNVSDMARVLYASDPGTWGP
ncbi:MAG TPA: hypothetical protein VGQ92_20930 [Actinoplanes sp.]|jgi:hypothetical protein|nr:hypothetical protein [Actinoplanes sp.]